MNRLGSNTQVDNSVVGADGSRTGTPVYASGKFGNGLDSPTNVNYVVFSNAITSPTQGILEWWWKPKWASTTGSNHDIINIENGTPAQFHIFWATAGQYMEIYFWEAGYKSRYRFTITFSANDLMHIAVVFDANASANNRIKVYKDGASQTLLTAVNDASWSFVNLDIQLWQKYFGATDAIFDNLKAHDNTGDRQLILNNRNYERFGLNDSRGVL
jgi:hypothetical protein